MSSLTDRLRALAPERLTGIRRGVEKESLRVDTRGALARTPHPEALGSALTHPHITTDFSESQVEMVTGAHARTLGCVEELRQIHQVVYGALAARDELLWVSSMPCELPPDHDIPIGRYGSSNVGLAKTVYRRGLAHRYGPRMQTISGIHYNWSIPGASDDDYFALIRNFRRHSFLLLMLFGASPAVPRSFVATEQHGLRPLGEDTLMLPHATSLRMGRLGYQSDAQKALAVSYNGLHGYAASLQEALTRPYPPYQTIGLQTDDGGFKQLSDTLLQIENEFYSTIRPKRVINPGERPLHALRERGVEYVEVRCMDLNPFLTVGIDEFTMRVLDVFLLHCLLAPSPLDTPDEIGELARNQHRVASRGREPGLHLERRGQEVLLSRWADEILGEGAALAEALDAAHGGRAHREAWEEARRLLQAPSKLPSARVLEEIRHHHGGSHLSFTLHRSALARQDILGLPLSAHTTQTFAEMAAQSLQEQARIEAADTLPFDAYRREYLSPIHLVI